MNGQIFADIVQTKNKDTEKLDNYILLKGEIYAEGTRLIPLTVEEFTAVYQLIFKMIKKSVNEIPPKKA